MEDEDEDVEHVLCSLEGMSFNLWCAMCALVGLIRSNPTIGFKRRKKRERNGEACLNVSCCTMQSTTIHLLNDQYA